MVVQTQSLFKYYTEYYYVFIYITLYTRSHIVIIFT